MQKSTKKLQATSCELWVIGYSLFFIDYSKFNPSNNAKMVTNYQFFSFLDTEYCD